MHPTHASSDFKGDTLFVLSAPPEEIEIGALEDFRDDFGTQEGDREQDSLAAWFDPRFLQALKSSVRGPVFSPVKWVRGTESGFPFRTYLDSGGPEQVQLRFWVPKQEALAAAGIAARYTLSVAGLEFARKTVPSYPDGKNEVLAFSFIYLIWDYRSNDFVACGTAEGATGTSFGTVKSDWQLILERAALKMLRQSPMKRYLKASPVP